MENSVWSESKKQGITSWTVLRDPYERFISGLSYDILNTNPKLKDNKDNIIEYITDNDVAEGVYSSVSRFFRSNKSVIHYISQATYYMGEDINYFVKLQDLNEFTKYNFPDCDLFYRDELNEKCKNIVEKAIESVPNLKTRIKDLLQVDYYMMDKIEQAGKFWKWQYGKVL
jgi:hypothetical protein